ncbi:type IV secretion protein Rhs, partial [Mixta theicola]
MHSSSHFDPQLGLDIHLYPWPLPTPHIGLVFDVFDYLPLLGTTVNVNSIKRSSAGTGGIAVHIPVGGVWVPPFRAPGGPQLDNELFMGSKTVSVDGEPFSRIGMPVLGCNIVGMIPPLRLKRTTKPKQLSLTLPLTFNLALPNNVNVGGPPTINLMALLMKAGLSGLGKGIKKLKKTPKWQQFMERFKKLRKKLFKNMDSGFLKCNMLRAEPVDIRDGSVHLEQQDFVVRGRLPLSWVRYYSSADIDEEGWCGYGWSTPADITLEIMPEEQAAMLHQPEGVMLFPALPDSDGIEHAVNGLPEGARLWREQGSDATCWRVALENNTELHFLGQTGQLPLEKVADFNGNAWLFSRQHGELKAIREFCLLGPTGREIIVTSEHGRLLALRLLDTRTGDLSPLIRYEYNQAGELIAQLDAFSHANTFRYRQRRMVSHIDRLGQGFHYAFDDAWRVVHAWGDGGVWDYHFDYHPLLNEVVVTDSLGHTSRITFDENGLPVSEIDPEGGNTILGYDTLGRTVSLIDPEGRHYRWEYDEQGRIVAEHLPGGGVIHARYNAAGQPLSHIDENGEEWQLQYDERGNLTAQSDPTGVTRRYRYDSLGQLSEADEPGTGITRYQYDDLGFPCAITESGAASLLLRHSVRGNPEQKTDGNGAVTHYFWDRKDRLTAICEPDGREIRFEYDREDRPVCCTDEAGRITRLSYTPTGMLSGCETADGARTLYHYDPEDRLLAVINQTGQRWQLTRDALGRVVTETDYYGQSTHYRWDKSENLIARRDPLGREVRYRYNAAGQLSERRCGDNPDTRYQYDACGRLVLCENPWRRLTWRYDAAGRILCEEQDDFQLRYRWNERGLLLSRESDAGHQVSYAWDGHDRLLGVQLNSDKPVRFSYNAHGQRSHEQLSDEVTRLLSYDPQGRLNAQQVVRGEQPLFSTGFSYDRDGNLTLKQDSLWGDDRYRYDPTGRLLAHCDPQGVIRRFVQDAAGNPFTSVLNESENQPERWSRTGSLNGVRYCFDRAGELRQRQSGQSDAEAEHFVWDEHRQLTAVRRGTRQVRYGYDGLGRRVF